MEILQIFVVDADNTIIAVRAVTSVMQGLETIDRHSRVVLETQEALEETQEALEETQEVLEETMDSQVDLETLVDN